MTATTSPANHPKSSRDQTRLDRLGSVPLNRFRSTKRHLSRPRPGQSEDLRFVSRLRESRKSVAPWPKATLTREPARMRWRLLIAHAVDVRMRLIPAGARPRKQASMQRRREWATHAKNKCDESESLKHRQAPASSPVAVRTRFARPPIARRRDRASKRRRPPRTRRRDWHPSYSAKPVAVATDRDRVSRSKVSSGMKA